MVADLQRAVKSHLHHADGHLHGGRLERGAHLLLGQLRCGLELPAFGSGSLRGRRVAAVGGRQWRRAPGLARSAARGTRPRADYRPPEPPPQGGLGVGVRGPASEHHVCAWPVAGAGRAHLLLLLLLLLLLGGLLHAHEQSHLLLSELLRALAGTKLSRRLLLGCLPLRTSGRQGSLIMDFIVLFPVRTPCTGDVGCSP